MKPRTYRDLRSAGRLPTCDVCKRPASVCVTEAHRRYWTDRFTMADIQFMAYGIESMAEAVFGERIPAVGVAAARVELALAASAATPHLTPG